MGRIKFVPGKLILTPQQATDIDKKFEAFDTGKILIIILITRE
jgi:hypothetical protein